MKAWVQRNLLRVKAVVAVVAAVAVGAVSAALPASPATAGCGWEKTWSWKGNIVQVDNCPYNGADSWIWLRNSGSNGAWNPLYARIWFYDGGYTWIVVNHNGESNYWNMWGRGDIWQVQLEDDRNDWSPYYRM
ncbi:hypothetical protein C1I95_27955 [Micromonospora craterilacus]|uniref:Streptomyces killer toxin-like beta/gamma crystallin domain-containing protein n=1 Tax=Micromonospora craterilacus TaxID=1655439 RepID=A0A2W2DZP8_9ACTN|nr:hypothetical protein [Micromonospora craterilacus]PZG10585.1 hypothetical protein C1I95_27955 [Micromonospora craterilacus]